MSNAVLTEMMKRLAQMLVDSDEAIVGGFFYTQDSIDQSIDRPCYIVFDEGLAFENTTPDQDLSTQSFSVAFIGQIYNAFGISTLSMEYEEQTRRIAQNALLYLKEHPQLQMSNKRGLFTKVGGFDGVLWTEVSGRSPISLFSRDGVAGEGFWGFTIDIDVTYQFTFETVGL